MQTDERIQMNDGFKVECLSNMRAEWVCWICVCLRAKTAIFRCTWMEHEKLSLFIVLSLEQKKNNKLRDCPCALTGKQCGDIASKKKPA